MFPRCPDCSCEHKEKCVQHDDVEEAVRELKARMCKDKGYSLIPPEERYCPTKNKEPISDGLCPNCKVIDGVFGEVDS